MARKTSRKIQEDAKFQVAQKNYQKFLGFIFVSFLLAYLIIIVRIHRDGFSETLVKIVGDPNLSDLYYTIAQSNFDNPWSRQIYELSANTYLPFPFILFNVLKLNYGTGSFIPTITDSLLIWIPLIIIAQTLVFILVKKRNRSPFVYGIAVLSSVLGLPMLQTTLRGNIQFIVFLMCVIYYAIVGNRGIHSIMRICIVVAIVTTKPQYLLVVLPGLFLYKNRIKEFIVSALISPVFSLLGFALFAGSLKEKFEFWFNSITKFSGMADLSSLVYFNGSLFASIADLTLLFTGGNTSLAQELLQSRFFFSFVVIGIAFTSSFLAKKLNLQWLSIWNMAGLSASLPMISYYYSYSILLIPIFICLNSLLSRESSTIEFFSRKAFVGCWALSTAFVFVPKPIWLNLGFDLATSIDSLFISIGWLIMPLTTVVYWASKRTSERPI